jgi:hypothetical protein
MANGIPAAVYLTSGTIEYIKPGLIYLGTGTLLTPHEGDSQYSIDLVTGLTTVFRYDQGEWVDKTKLTGSTISSGFFIEVKDAENEAVTRQGLIYYNKDDLATIGQPKAINMVRRSFTPDAITVGSPRWESILMGSDSGCLTYKYISGPSFQWVDNDNNDTSTETSIENFITPDQDVWCEDLQMRFGLNTLVSPRTRIFEVVSGRKVYDSTSDADWENGRNQVNFPWPSEGQYINLNSQWEFFLRKDVQYRIQRDVKDPITSYGFQDGATFKPYLELKLYPLRTACVINSDTLTPDYKAADFTAENIKTYNVDTTLGAVVVTVPATIDIFYIQDAKGNWTNINKVTVNVGTDSVELKQQQRRQIYTFIRKDTVWWVYDGRGKFLQELTI